MAYINRLTAKHIDKIIRLIREDNLPNKVLAARFEVSSQTIVDIRKKYVPESLGVGKNPSGLSAKGVGA